MIVKNVIFAIVLASPVTAQEWSLSLGGVSHHVNATRKFNEINPSLGMAVSWGEQWRATVSGGVFYNSYEHWSTYVLAGLDMRIVDTPRFDLYAGVWAGFAGYPNLVAYADRNGIPRIGNHIMVAGLSAIAKFERVEYVLRYIPFGDKMDGVASLSIRIPFNQT